MVPVLDRDQYEKDLKTILNFKNNNFGLKSNSRSSNFTAWPLLREKSGKFYFSSWPGKSRGVLQNGQKNFKVREKSGNFIILTQNYLAVLYILAFLSDRKS